MMYTEGPSYLVLTTAFVPQDSAVKTIFAAIKNPNMYRYDQWLEAFFPYLLQETYVVDIC